MYARIAAEYISAWCEKAFDTNPSRMESTMANGEMIDVFDHHGHGTHKYIPADRLTEELGMPAGGGVYGYWKLADGSYLLLTCGGRLAYWSGRPEDKAEWPEKRMAKV